ncbi:MULTISPECIES: LysE family translocator [Vibrio]|uniref:LysE family translocator n=1 Tax=Vibrio casei TaxID=673372 RepID=A0A368LIJ0_9VIBR|nr:MULTISPECIES: LysE family translocator [Vibrio]RCS70518.1 LysE family translocator [Vibrio casei]SJN27866.1 Putative threonine efflux protein [Vibrio casei]HBV77888.1 LysE family translocator [Vibrio sp.]
MTFTIWFSLLLICLLGAMSPGPSLAMVAKHSLAGGRKNGLATAWAHAFGIGLYALFTILGLAILLHQFPFIFKLLTYAGAAYLAWLGLNAIQSKGGIAERLESGKTCSVVQSAKEGFYISILSPKIAIFFTALFSQFVAVSTETSSKVIIVLTPFIVDGLWYSFITFMLSSQVLLATLRSKAHWIDRLSGVVLIALAIRVALMV